MSNQKNRYFMNLPSVCEIHFFRRSDVRFLVLLLRPLAALRAALRQFPEYRLLLLAQTTDEAHGVLPCLVDAECEYNKLLK